MRDRNAKFLRNGIVMLVLVLGTVALMYAWFLQPPNTATKGYSDFLNDVQNGKVTSVSQQDQTLSVQEGNDKCEAAVAGDGEIAAAAVRIMFTESEPRQILMPNVRQAIGVDRVRGHRGNRLRQRLVMHGNRIDVVPAHRLAAAKDLIASEC